MTLQWHCVLYSVLYIPDWYDWHDLYDWFEFYHWVIRLGMMVLISRIGMIAMSCILGMTGMIVSKVSYFRQKVTKKTARAVLSKGALRI